MSYGRSALYDKLTLLWFAISLVYFAKRLLFIMFWFGFLTANQHKKATSARNTIKLWLLFGCSLTSYPGRLRYVKVRLISPVTTGWDLFIVYVLWADVPADNACRRPSRLNDPMECWLTLQTLNGLLRHSLKKPHWLLRPTLINSKVWLNEVLFIPINYWLCWLQSVKGSSQPQRHG